MDAPSENVPAPVEAPDETRLLQELPREIGVLLMSVGALGSLLPGMIGTPAVIAGGLVLWPRAFIPVERWFGRNYPEVHRKSVEQVRRYLADLEQRYPNPKKG